MQDEDNHEIVVNHTQSVAEYRVRSQYSLETIRDALKALSDPPARRTWAVLGSALFLIIAAGIGAGLVPWWISRWRVQAPLFGFPPIRVLGVILIVLAIPVVLDSFARFALQGLGTPAPVFPTLRLVVKGFYRYVRNPIYLAVVSVILGEGMILGNVSLLAYGVLAWLVTHLFVVTYEEPTLRKTFSAEYDAFCANVPRWVPRLRPWSGNTRPTARTGHNIGVQMPCVETARNGGRVVGKQDQGTEASNTGAD